MNQRKHLTLIAAASAFLAAMPLSNVFERWTWMAHAFLIVAVMCGVAVLVRSLRAPTWAPTVAMAVSALFALTWLYPSHHELLGIIPGPGTFVHFGDLLTTASTEMSEFATPVGDRQGFLFLATLGVAAVALIVDLFAVVLRRPALAGLPMLAIYSVPVTVTTESTSWFPFVLGAVGFLWLLVTDNVDRVRRFGRRFTGDGRDVDLWEPSPLAAAGQRLGLLGVAIAVIIPLIPFAMPPGVLESFGGSGGSGPGIGTGRGNSRTVSMFALLQGQLTRDKAFNMVKVTNINDPSPLYLRFGVAEELTSAGFSTRPPTAGQPINSGLPGPGLDGSVKTTTHKATIEVTNELAIADLPIYSYPVKIDKVDSSWVFDQNTAVVYSNKKTTAKLKYTVEYVKADPTADQLRAAAPLKDGDPALRGLTTAPANTKVKETVKGLTVGKTTEYDKVMAIFDFFSTANGFVYDTSTGADTSGTKIADFLQNKRGYCAQYAAALGWLLREAKIPSRVAFGFSHGGAIAGSTMTLTNYNLHAWTEVYFPGYGWLQFDATPATAIGGSVSTTYAKNPSALSSDNNNLDPNNHGGPGADPNASAGAAGPLGPQGGPGDTGTKAVKVSFARHLADLALQIGPWLLGGLLLLGLILAPSVTRSRTRRQRLRFRAARLVGPSPPGSPPVEVAEHVFVAARADAHQAWDELIDTMVDYQVPVDDAETPRSTVDRLIKVERLQDRAQEAVRLLSAVEEHARYARQPLTGSQMTGALDSVRSSFASRASRRTRLMAVIMPPSVVRRWRVALSGRSSTMTVSAGQGWERLMRTLSVRRFATRRADR